ncbi:methylthioribulose 1-phosphate dehydratase [uncultured Sphingomonas sp.]|uniref:methylthioribulose 1-phosphate dehydratase n=1 Tax=uncultured Sphingomonas sp. TaxID=158754 RepID=UPI0035CC5861
MAALLRAGISSADGQPDGATAGADRTAPAHILDFLPAKRRRLIVASQSKDLRLKMARMVFYSFADAQAGIVDVGRRIAAQGWAPATAGNYSARTADGFAVTASGRHKGRLTESDILRLDGDGAVIGDGRPSAETALHLALYRRFPDAGAVLHGHSPAAVALTRAYPARIEWRFAGHEMLKAFPGVTTHKTAITLPIVDNSQDMAVIEAAVMPALNPPGVAPAYLIRDHGLYAWGADLDEAERILEAVEWLIAAELAERGFREKAR